MKRKLLALTLIVFMAMAFGCAMTQKGKLIQAQNTFYGMVTAYNQEMDFQTDETIKAELRLTFLPLFEKGDAALKAYEQAVMAGMDEKAKLELFLFLKNQILLEFLRMGIKYAE